MEKSVPHPWIQAIKAQASSVLNDRENQRITNELVRGIHAQNPNRVDEFEFYRPQSNFGSSAQFDGLMKTFSEREIQKVNFLKSWKGGIKFKFDASSDKAGVKSLKSNGQPFRYGLRLKNIDPNQRKQLFAAHNMEDMAFVDSAPKADVQWTIDRVVADNGHSKKYAVQLVEAETNHPYLDQFTSTKFKGTVVPDPNTDFLKLKGLPPQIIHVHQENGFYSLLVHTNGQLNPESYLHVFNFVFDSLVLRSERDKELDPTKYTLGHHAKSMHLFSNINYLPLESRYQAEFKYIYGANHINL